MNKLIVSSSPHIRSSLTTQRIMLDVLIALLPTTVASIVLFRLKALWLILTCCLTALATEALFQLIAKREQTITDGSALVTGLLLALSLHANVPLWQAAVGTVFAIAVVKLCFGGLGKNFANPAITGRIFVLMAFAEASGGAYSYNTVLNNSTSVIETMATPLNKINEESAQYLPSLKDMFLGTGNCGGAIGEVCSLALLIGFAYLLIRRVISWHTPVTVIGTVFLLSWALSGNITFALYHVLAGGLLIAAIFMATDYVTTPINKLGKLVFGFGCGLITVLVRFFGAYPEGISFAILFMNILTPYIEKWTKARPLGAKRGGARK
ncbi:MAG: RnfABCDGE type electron transport complex subunit D [Clostridia bacterium]|nr:RnfABCDGE type electron transport complex subunit D [Clostridia bacterium]MBQ5739426.1 RnfABCDGE type electron transport complex subunit D [Oscillospiraceae bacterium]